MKTARALNQAGVFAIDSDTGRALRRKHVNHQLMLGEKWPYFLCGLGG
jgi:hypothetical protein